MRCFRTVLLTLALACPGWAAAETDPPALEPLLREEIQRLDGVLDGRMGIALFRTDDPVVQGFVSSGILKIPAEAYLRLESGLASVAVLQGSHNGVQRPMCYVLYNPPRAKPVENGYYLPIGQATGDYRQAAAFLAGHETGHCLDHLEREVARGKEMRWTAEQANLVGLHPDAFLRVFGVSTTTAFAATGAYGAKANDLYGDLAQRQYEERIADAFGVMWVWRMGGSPKVLDAVRASRLRERATNAHATAPILDAVAQHKEELGKTTGIDGVWTLARRLQRETGVDPALGPGSQVAKNPLAEELQKAKDERKKRPPPPQPKSQSWQAIPRFGAPPLR